MLLWHETAKIKSKAVTDYVKELLLNSGSDDKFLVFAYHRCVTGQCACSKCTHTHMHQTLCRPLEHHFTHCYCPCPHHPTPTHTHTQLTVRELMDAIEKGVNEVRGKNKELKELKYMRIDGQTPPKQREENVNNFQDDQACRVSVSGYEERRAGGVLTCLLQCSMLLSDYSAVNALTLLYHVLFRTLPSCPLCYLAPHSGGHPEHQGCGCGPHPHTRQHCGLC